MKLRAIVLFIELDDHRYIFCNSMLRLTRLARVVRIGRMVRMARTAKVVQSFGGSVRLLHNDAKKKVQQTSDSIKAGIHTTVEAIKPVVTGGLDKVKSGLTSAVDFLKPHVDAAGVRASHTADSVMLYKMFAMLKFNMVRTGLTATKNLYSTSYQSIYVRPDVVSERIIGILKQDNVLAIFGDGIDGKVCIQNLESCPAAFRSVLQQLDITKFSIVIRSEKSRYGDNERDIYIDISVIP